MVTWKIATPLLLFDSCPKMPKMQKSQCCIADSGGGHAPSVEVKCPSKLMQTQIFLVSDYHTLMKTQLSILNSGSDNIIFNFCPKSFTVSYTS